MNSVEIEGNLLENWQTAKIKTVIFIQNKATKEVLQAESTL
jgi:hypothetical protein